MFLDPNTRNFVRLAVAVQRQTGIAMPEAKAEAARILGADIPSDEVFNAVLAEPQLRGMHGRRPASDLTKRDAVAVLAVYFQSIGAGKEQAIREATRWLGVNVSRSIVVPAVARHKSETHPDQYQPLALWAYATYRRGTTLPLPAEMTKSRRPRRKSVPVSG